MMEDFIDYPTFKERNPEKTFEDWLRLSREKTYNDMQEMLDREKESLTDEEIKEAKQMIKEYKKEILQ